MIQHRFTNNLINETSPYLLQHAHNPIRWFAWGAEALQLALTQDKPIFLSIGYTACHWCHVMERESFENEDIANLLNEHFIAIKVDREERPDLDEIYMTAVQLLTQSGGWPLSVWLTPDLKPFFGGTYFPPDNRYGRMGFKNVLQSIAHLWQNDRSRIEQNSEDLSHYIQQVNRADAQPGELSFDLWLGTASHLEKAFDEHHGGFGSAPKFPHALELSWLIRYFYHTGSRKSLERVEKSLFEMARGGIFDQIGGGFHRYATDAEWRIPHFEKMLYDNALLPIAYLEAYQVTGKTFYAEIARRTLDYVLRELQAPEGGFYSSQDADSEGEEGKFYVWLKSEIEQELGDQARLVCDYFDISAEGNWEATNILYCRHDDAQFAKAHQLTAAELSERLAAARNHLYQARASRIKPMTDEKILTEWNAWMIRALVKGYQVLQEVRYLNAGREAIACLEANLIKSGRVLRTYCGASARLGGYLSDYAALVAALLDLYESTFEASFLTQALTINHWLLEKFWDSGSGTFFFSATEHATPLARVKHLYDNVIPAGNSIAVQNLLRISQLLDQPELKLKAESAAKVCAKLAEQSPMGFAYLLAGLDFLWGRPKQIVLSGNKNSPDLREMLTLIHQRYLPDKVLAFADPGIDTAGGPLAGLAALLSGKISDTGQAKIYVCENKTCQTPFITCAQFQHYYQTLVPVRESGKQE